MTVRGKDILNKTVSKYLGETRKLLRYLDVPHNRLANYTEKQNTLKRTPTLKPKVEYCDLEWRQVKRICTQSRAAVTKQEDNLLGRAILTFAFTTSTRVGSILPPK